MVEMCEVSALGRDSEHPDLGIGSPFGRRIRGNYFHVLSAFRSYADRHNLDWVLPDWASSVDVEGEADARVRKWSMEHWVGSDVEQVRRALGHHLALLDQAASGAVARKDRKSLNRQLFLVGAEAKAMYNVVTRIYAPTRADRRRLDGQDGLGSS